MTPRCCVVLAGWLLGAAASCAPPPSPQPFVLRFSCGHVAPVVLEVGDTIRLHVARIKVDRDVETHPAFVGGSAGRAPYAVSAHYNVETCQDSVVSVTAWQSFRQAVVTIDEAGLAEARGPGTGSISARTPVGVLRDSIIVVPSLQHFGWPRDTVVGRVGVPITLAVEMRDVRGRPVSAHVALQLLGPVPDWHGSLIQRVGESVAVYTPETPGMARVVAAIGHRADTLVIVIP